MNTRITRTIAGIVAAAFIFTQCGIGIAQPIYNKEEMLRQAVKEGKAASAGGELEQEIRTAGAGNQGYLVQNSAASRARGLSHEATPDIVTAAAKGDVAAVGVANAASSPDRKKRAEQLLAEIRKDLATYIFPEGSDMHPLEQLMLDLEIPESHLISHYEPQVRALMAVFKKHGFDLRKESDREFVAGLIPPEPDPRPLLEIRRDIDTVKQQLGDLTYFLTHGLKPHAYTPEIGNAYYQERDELERRIKQLKREERAAEVKGYAIERRPGFEGSGAPYQQQLSVPAAPTPAAPTPAAPTPSDAASRATGGKLTEEQKAGVRDILEKMKALPYFTTPREGEITYLINLGEWKSGINVEDDVSEVIKELAGFLSALQIALHRDKQRLSISDVDRYNQIIAAINRFLTEFSPAASRATGAAVGTVKEVFDFIKRRFVFDKSISVRFVGLPRYDSSYVVPFDSVSDDVFDETIRDLLNKLVEGVQGGKLGYDMPNNQRIEVWLYREPPLVPPALAAPSETEAETPAGTVGLDTAALELRLQEVPTEIADIVKDAEKGFELSAQLQAKVDEIQPVVTTQEKTLILFTPGIVGMLNTARTGMYHLVKTMVKGTNTGTAILSTGDVFRLTSVRTTEEVDGILMEIASEAGAKNVKLCKLADENILTEGIDTIVVDPAKIRDEIEAILKRFGIEISDAKVAAAKEAYDIAKELADWV